MNNDLVNEKKLKAVIVHINGLERTTPLAGGYLKAYAMSHEDIANNWDIELYSEFVEKLPASKLIADTVDLEPDLVGFSVYTWNGGLVQRVLPTLRALLPNACFVMGGAEVINHAAQYVRPEWEDVLVCNGEGEKTFLDLLRVLQSGSREFESVGGVSYYLRRELKTTTPHPRIKSLDEIPSPYLNGYFDRGNYSVALFETNRGCPYRCEFCFWGGAVGQKLHRMGKDRIHAEIERMGELKVRAVYLCDANFGIFPQDPDITRTFMDTKKTFGYPRFIRYSAAKNNPDRSAEVAEILAEGGIQSAQPLSLQSLNEHTLKLAKRENIPLETYFRLQSRMNQAGIASFVELIWPMPGETLETFKKGLASLGKMGVQAVSVYQLSLLNNCGYTDKQEELGIATLRCGDPNGTSMAVIQTKEASYGDWIEGLVYTSAFQMLYGCRGLYHTLAIVEGLGITTMVEVLERWSKWMDGLPNSELFRIWNMLRTKVDEIYSTLSWPGNIVDAVLNERAEFDAALNDFIDANQDIFGGQHRDVIQAAYEFDRLTRPYVYQNTPMDPEPNLAQLRILESRKKGWMVECPFDIPRVASHMRAGGAGDIKPESVVFEIDHGRPKVFKMRNRTQKEYWDECRMFAIEIGNQYPTWKREDAPGASDEPKLATRSPSGSNPQKTGGSSWRKSG